MCHGSWTGVLILVVVEDGLRVYIDEDYYATFDTVLILVVVEDGLRGVEMKLKSFWPSVLILVVVEDGLRVCKQQNSKEYE